jgi:multiple sugar transport system substrate-binding protein
MKRFVFLVMILALVMSTSFAVFAQDDKVVVEFWTTDNEEPRIDMYEAIAEAFMVEHPNIDVRIVPIEEGGITQRVSTAVAANRLPDIIRMGVERVSSFSADGLLDHEAATAVIQAVGEDDFRNGPLMMVTDPMSGDYMAIPYDGWIQAIWYRSDVFAELGLDAPNSWDAIKAACEAMPGVGDLLYGMTIGTDPGQNYGNQIFEQVAISNNAWPFDAEGNVSFNTPEMIEALAFYTSLQDCATPGPQYWRGAREAYQYGTSGMFFYSTYIMDDLVDGSGLEAGGILEITIDDLPGNTGFTPTMTGPNGDATYGQLVTLGITRDADPEAQLVAEWFLTEGYVDVLSLAPFGKVPVLESAVEGWSTLSPYFENYPPETLAAIGAGFDTMQRWLFRPDYGPIQRAVIGDIEGQLLIPMVISNIAIEGSMTPEEAAEFLQGEVEELLEERSE